MRNPVVIFAYTKYYLIYNYCMQASMGDFFSVFVSYQFIQNAVLAGILSGIACGITGTFVVIKKITYLAGGVAHAVMGGIGIAYYLGVNPLAGALVFAMLSAILIGLVKLRFRQNEDTMIGALWASGMAIGVLFIYLTPGYNADLLSFLFGNILMVSKQNLAILAVLDIIILIVVAVFFRQLIYVSFDEEYSAIRGISVDFIYLLLLSMIALTVVVLIQAVGLILIIALLTLPAAIAGLFAGTPGRMMVYAVLLNIGFNMAGLLVSFYLNIPSGASIILVAAFGYMSALGISATMERIRSAWAAARTG